MLLEIERFLFVNLVYVICTTLAAFIIWGEDVRRYFTRFLLYVLLASLAQSLTSQLAFKGNLEVLRFIIEVASCYIIALLAFRQTGLWTFKIFAVSYLMGYLTVGIGIASVIFLMHKPFSVLEDQVLYWLTVLVPVNILAIPLAWLLRRMWTARRSVMQGLKTGTTWTPSIFAALFVQTVLFVALSGQILFNYSDRSGNETLMLFLGMLLIFALSIYILVKYTAFSRGEIAATQDAVSENITEMINTVKGQRHDFINHLQVIHGLNQINDQEALNEYLSELLYEVNRYNEMIKIDNPIIAALVNAKVSQANNRGIDLQVQVKTTLSHISSESIDLARILGNLIDNAMDGAKESGDNWVNIDIAERNSMIVCSVTNPFKGNAEDLKKSFAPGLSTKPQHDGLGLYVCQKLCTKIKGKLDLQFANDQQVTFSLSVPLTSH